MRLYRSVDPAELASIESSGAYSLHAGQEGKPFFTTEQPAHEFSRRIFPVTGQPQTVTSVEVASNS